MPEVWTLGGQGWFTPESFDDGPGLFAAVVEAGLEGGRTTGTAGLYRLQTVNLDGTRSWVGTASIRR